MIFRETDNMRLNADRMKNPLAGQAWGEWPG